METLYRKSTEKPNNEGVYNTSKGLLSYSKTFGWVTIENYTTSAPDYWFKETPDNSNQLEKLKADNEELLEALKETNRRISIIKSEPDGIVRETMIDMLPIGIESLIQKMKQ